jgi:hypothetical protein
MGAAPDPNVEIGIIGTSPWMYRMTLTLGLGDMGRMYARLISKAGWK